MGVEDLSLLCDILDPSGRGHCTKQSLVDLDTSLNGNTLAHIHIEATFKQIVATSSNKDVVHKQHFMPVRLCVQLILG